MKTKIIVDSNADLMPDIKQQVSVIPLTVRFGDEEFIDGITIDHHTFYKKLTETDVFPSTSQGTPYAFEQEYEKVKAAGESAVVITLASKLSGTYQSACVAAQSYENIYVVDSASVAIGSGILVELALQFLNEGLSAKEIAEELEKAKKRIIVIALVDTLEYLKRGGRISKQAAFAGTMLNIKPVVSVVDGEIIMIGKARGSRLGIKLLTEEIEKIGVDFSKPVLLGYTGTDDTFFQKYKNDSNHIWEQGKSTIRYTTIGSVIGTHVGPGTVAAAFFKK